jgi:P4 family phage/plasmid primase-like protien
MVLDDLFVVDIDKKYGGLESLAAVEVDYPELMWPTLVQETPSGGLQFVYRQPPERDIYTIGQRTSDTGLPAWLTGWEIKGLKTDGTSGHYVGVPPSRGRRWRDDWWSRNEYVTDATPQLLKIIREVKRRSGSGPSGSVNFSGDSFDWDTALTYGAVMSNQEDCLFRAACSLRMHDVDDDEAIAKLTQVVMNFVNLNPSYPWHPNDAVEKWQYVKGKFAPGVGAVKFSETQDRWRNKILGKSTPSWAQDTMKLATLRLIGVDDVEVGVDEGSDSDSDSDTEITGDGGDDGGGGGGLAIGELQPPDHWYGANDDGTAQRIKDMWGDWFRAIPKARGGYSWIIYDGITWSLDTRERIWDSVGSLLARLPLELALWRQRVTELTSEGVDDWRTELVGGNGINAGRPNLVVALEKYGAACKENARKESGVKAFARLPEITISENDLDAKTRYVALPDGRVLDVEAVHTGAERDEWLVPARPDMLMTKLFGCGYVAPDENRPGTLYELSSFRRYLEDVLPDPEVRKTLQEIVGYALLGHPTEKLIVLLHGPSDSGKTVLLEVLSALFGNYAGWTDGQALIGGKAKSAHSEWLNNIRGLRMVLTPETPKGAKIDAAWVKSYTGREPQTSRAAFGDRSVTWIPSGIIFNGSNHYLEYDAEDTAVAERTQVIEFEERFLRGDPRRDDRLPQKIKAELPIVLNWALEGLRRHGSREIPVLAIAPKIRDWSERYRTQQDHVGQFIADAVEEKRLMIAESSVAEFVSHYAEAKVVYGLYKSWCMAQNRKPLGRNSFNDHLHKVYNWESAVVAGKRWLGITCGAPDGISAEITQW